MPTKNKRTKNSWLKARLLDTSAFNQKQLFVGSLVMMCISIITLGLALSVVYRNNRMTPQPQAGFTPGVTITQGLVSMRVGQARMNSGNYPFKVPSGKSYTVTEIQITNRSDKAINVFPANDFYLKSADGSTALVALNNLDNPLRAGSLPAGETIKGDVSFVTENTQSYKLYVDSIWSGGVLPFKLKP